MPLKPKSEAPTGIFEGESVDRYNFRPALRRLLQEPEPAKRARTPTQQSNESPMKPAKLANTEPKVSKADKLTSKFIAQRDEARSQLKTVTAQLKRSQDSLQSAHTRIGSLESTVAKLKEKPLQAKSTETTDLIDLVNTSTKQILDEIKSVRTSHVSLQEAVSTLANAPIEITQPAPVPPVSNRPPQLTAASQRRPNMGDAGSDFQRVLNQSRDYHDLPPHPRMPLEYWRNSVDDHYFEANSRQEHFQPYTPDYVTQRQNGTPMPPTQFQVRRVLPPGFGLPTASVDPDSAEGEATLPEPAKKKRGKK